MAGTVALVLGSGGARGMAHIGVIKEIEARGYEIISVSGCSVGAVVGAFYSANKLDAFYEWAISLNYLNVLRLVDFSFISNGAIRGDRLFSKLSEMLGDIQIEDLKIPYTAVATDLTSSKEVWFQRGSLEKAMRASAAIPGLIQPVEYDHRLYVDGGVLNPLPIAASVSAHADYIIAVDLGADVPIPVITDVKHEKEDAENVARVQAEQVETTKPQTNTALDKKEEKSLFPGKLQFINPEVNNNSLWFNSMVDKASDWFSSGDASGQVKSSEETEGTQEAGDTVKTDISAAKMGKLGILYQMFEVMQTSLSQYKIAGYPPDLLVKIPKDCVEMYEFYRANELVEMGRYIAKDALDAFEQGHSSLYGQRLGSR